MVSDILRGECCKGCRRLLLRSMAFWFKRHDIGLYEGDLAECLYLDVVCTCGTVTKVWGFAQPIGEYSDSQGRLFRACPTARARKEGTMINFDGKNNAIKVLCEHIERTAAFVGELAQCKTASEVKRLMLDYNDILDMLDKIVDFDAILE